MNTDNFPFTRAVQILIQITIRVQPTSGGGLGNPAGLARLHERTQISLIRIGIRVKGLV